MTQENLPVLGYWNIRGVCTTILEWILFLPILNFFFFYKQNAQPIRLLLAYTKTPYFERAYNFGKGEFEREEWHKEKYTIGLDFPNVNFFDFYFPSLPVLA